MRVRASLLAGICASAISFPAFAQEATDDDLTDPQFGNTVIIVTAQRQAQSLQEVPIAVSAFDAEALEAQQIENSSDLQLSLPNITFTKTNFTSSSFTIRGSVTCASAFPAIRPRAFTLMKCPCSLHVCLKPSSLILSGSKCCAVRKERFSGATRHRVWSMW